MFNGHGSSWLSFAVSHQRTGAPFAIYQLRRAWVSTTIEENNRRITHAHAIAVLPGGIIKEIHCNAFRFRVRPKFLCRHTALEVAQERLKKYFDESINKKTDNLDSAKELTKEFYGLQLPPHQDPFWQKRSDTGAQTIANPWYAFNSIKESVEAVWYEAINPREEAVFYHDWPDRLESRHDEFTNPQGDPNEYHYDLVRVIPGEEQNDFPCCICNDPAVASWAHNLEVEVWHLCQNCQAQTFHGWPDYVQRLGLQT